MTQNTDKQNANTQALSDAGVSIWLDDLSRERLNSGSLKELIDTKNVVGVTTNPSIFAAALSNGEAYADQVKELTASNTPVEDAVFEITTQDVANAAELFTEIFADTDGVDGRVSIEVDPRSSRDAKATVAEARRITDKIGRENILVKIPATVEGLEAITETIAAGISVNVTLIFSLERYRAVINAYQTGLEQALAAGKDLSKIHSVASFFVSRVDSEIDKRLEALGTDDAAALKGKAGVANAQLAYQVYEQAFSTERWSLLESKGARRQRPLWASTGVKDPSLPDTLYVTGLAASNVVNTMPEKTLEALADHGTVEGDTVTGSYEQANGVLDAVAAQGIDYADVVDQLEREGLEKFVDAWEDLLKNLDEELQKKSDD